MDQLFHIGAALLGLAALLLTAQGAAWLLTEWRGPLIKVKPLNCRACLTFWLTLVVFTGWYLESKPASETALISAAFAFINYFYINSKFKVYE